MQMFPEDRVLVGVINRKRDLKIAQSQHWYRIPQKRMSHGINSEYLAFFLSGRVFKAQSGSVCYYARVRGVELVYRRDLLPEQADHPRADERYFKVALDPLSIKEPPIVNTTKRTITFIRTTWDRFVNATEINDLYSDADYFVDRIYHALRSRGIRSERFWETDSRTYDHAPGLRVLCEDGALTTSTHTGDGIQLLMDKSQSEQTILDQIMAEIKKRGGPADLSLPLN